MYCTEFILIELNCVQFYWIIADRHVETDNLCPTSEVGYVHLQETNDAEDK